MAWETHYLVQHVDDQEWDGHYKVSETILRPQFNTAQVDSFIDAGNPIRVSSSAPKPWTMRAKPTLI